MQKEEIVNVSLRWGGLKFYVVFLTPFFPKGIKSYIFDIAILFDGSSFITQEQFRQCQLFAKTVLAIFNISQDQTNAAAAVYATNVGVSFNFTEHYSLSAVSTAIDNIASLNQSSLNISAALEVVNNTLFLSGRENVTRIVLIFVSEILSGDFTALSQDLRDQRIIIILIGVGINVNVAQLKVIANKPSLVLTTTFQHIDTVEGIIGGEIAQGKNIHCML